MVAEVPVPEQTMTVEQPGQLFYDSNALQSTVPSAMAMALDQSGVYIQLTNHLVEMPFFKFHGGVERKRSSLGKKSTAFTTQQTLVRTVRGAMEGRTFQESDSARVETPNLAWDNFEQRAQEMHAYFETLAQHLGGNLNDRDSLLYTSPGLQVLGLAFNDLSVRWREHDPLAYQVPSREDGNRAGSAGDRRYAIGTASRYCISRGSTPGNFSPGIGGASA